MNSWPSNRVVQGGLFHPAKVTYSKETHELLKLLMEEQKMSILQRSQIESYLRRGEPLPQSKPKVSFKSKSTDCWPGADLMRPKSTKRRTLTAIKASGAHDRDNYNPRSIPPHESWEQKKIRLQEQMSGLKHFTLEDAHRRLKQKETSAGEAALNIDPVDELLQEISERAEWLDEMNKLGEGQKYRRIIETEISDRLRLIKQIESSKEKKSPPTQ